MKAADDPDSQKMEPFRRKLARDMERFASEPGGTEGDVSGLLASPSGALMLVDTIDSMDKPILKTKRELAIRVGYAHADPAIRDLFERFVPEERRVKRLGTAIKATEIFALAGDAERGRALFFQTAGVQCKNCHRIGEQGQALGPDLTQIGKKLDKAKLLESILEPSKAIDPQYVAYLVETTSGEVISGLLAKRTDEEVVLKQAEGKEVKVPAKEIERMAPQQKSLMPDLLLKEMTGQQVADLLEYLVNLQ
jgi:putative heme-binding domain-containing protein